MMTCRRATNLAVLPLLLLLSVGSLTAVSAFVLPTARVSSTKLLSATPSFDPDKTTNNEGNGRAVNRDAVNWSTYSDVDKRPPPSNINNIDNGDFFSSSGLKPLQPLDQPVTPMQAEELRDTLHQQHQERYQQATSQQDYEFTLQQILVHTNKERLRAGRSELRVNAELSKAAQMHATDMAKHDYFSHTGKNGSTLAHRIQSWTKYRYQNVAENLYWQSPDNIPHEAVEGWVTSTTGHKETLLDPKFTELGIGYAYSPAKQMHYHVQVLGAPLPVPTMPTTRSTTLRDEPPTSMEETRQVLLFATNQARRQYNVPPVQISDILHLAAQQHAEELAHRGFDNVNKDVAVEPGYYKRVAANLSVREPFNDPHGAVQGWLQKQSYKAVLLASQFKHVGLGYAVGYNDRDGTQEHYYVQLMGIPEQTTMMPAVGNNNNNNYNTNTNNNNNYMTPMHRPSQTPRVTGGVSAPSASAYAALDNHSNSYNVVIGAKKKSANNNYNYNNNNNYNYNANNNNIDRAAAYSGSNIPTIGRFGGYNNGGGPGTTTTNNNALSYNSRNYNREYEDDYYYDERSPRTGYSNSNSNNNNYYGAPGDGTPAPIARGYNNNNNNNNNRREFDYYYDANDGYDDFGPGARSNNPRGGIRSTGPGAGVIQTAPGTGVIRSGGGRTPTRQEEVVNGYDYNVNFNTAPPRNNNNNYRNTNRGVIGTGAGQGVLRNTNTYRGEEEYYYDEDPGAGAAGVGPPYYRNNNNNNNYGGNGVGRSSVVMGTGAGTGVIGTGIGQGVLRSSPGAGAGAGMGGQSRVGRRYDYNNMMVEPRRGGEYYEDDNYYGRAGPGYYGRNTVDPYYNEDRFYDEPAPRRMLNLRPDQ